MNLDNNPIDLKETSDADEEADGYFLKMIREDSKKPTKEILNKKHKRESAKVIHPKQKKIFKPKQICNFYVNSACHKGAQCTFSHDVAQMKKKDLCKYFLTGNCFKGEKCTFSHNTEDFPCKFFQARGWCDLDDCKFSHERMTGEEITKFIRENEEFLFDVLTKYGKTNMDDYFFKYLKEKNAAKGNLPQEAMVPEFLKVNPDQPGAKQMFPPQMMMANNQMMKPPMMNPQMLQMQMMQSMKMMNPMMMNYMINAYAKNFPPSRPAEVQEIIYNKPNHPTTPPVVKPETLNKINPFELPQTIPLKKAEEDLIIIQSESEPEFEEDESYFNQPITNEKDDKQKITNMLDFVNMMIQTKNQQNERIKKDPRKKNIKK